MKRLPLPFGSTISKFAINNPQSLVNLYAIKSDDGSKNKFFLKAREGLRKLFNFPNNPILGIAYINGYLYAATPNKVYKANLSGAVDVVGDVDFPPDRKVFISYDGQHIVFVGGKIYGYDDTDGFRQLKFTTGDSFPSVGMVTFMNYKFIVSSIDDGRFFWNDVFSLNFDPTYYATAEGEPDRLEGLISDGKKLYLFGTETTEVWYDTGDSFARVPGAMGPPGCLSYKTIVLLRDIVFFVGSDGVVYMMSGLQRQRISNNYVERRLEEESYSNLKSYGFIYEGRAFYCIEINRGETLCYNLESKTWHKRVSPQKLTWLPSFAVNSYTDAVLVSDTGNVYQLDSDYYKDDGEDFIKSLHTITLHNNGEFFTLNGLELELKQGDQIAGEFYLEYSEDGKNFSNIRTANIGNYGQYRNRLMWWRLGRHRNLILNLFTFEPREIIISNLWGYLNG